jgi:RNA polymerase sigma-70 factor (ECF subfamily)
MRGILSETGWMSDEELMRRAAGGDEAAFTELYRRRQPALYRFAYQTSGSAAIAEDVVQEVFLSVIRKAVRYDGARGSVAAFLFGVARNYVLRALDGRRERPDPEDVAAEGDLAGDVERSRMIESVRAAVLALPLHYREAVVLCDLQGLPYEQAAEALGCAVGTVRSRLHRARQMLAERLGAEPVRCAI